MTTGEPFTIRVAASGTRFTIRTRSVDQATGDPIVEQYITMFIRGMVDGENAGPDKPDHTFPEDARANPIGDLSVHVDDDQTFRYRDASGDQMPIHVDDDFAKQVGLPGIIAHGLCTMAMTSQAVLRLAADSDPSRVASPRRALREERVPRQRRDHVGLQGGTVDGRVLYPFEAHSASALVISNGFAEVDA